ncbi:HpcH/HpaI aldolase family protein [Ostreiculturibacter nitratireducens]|uniref:HpcH/HpaI aldolase family protein n=1 Tax=Ostreiculturibacter nitratireducens TaxID=3075226 RepID=UPI0031B5F629
MRNGLKARLAEGGMIAAAWAELGNPDVAEILVRHGWRTIVIDGEHGRGELEDWVAVARAIEAAGGEVILRLPDGSDTMIKRALDRGFRSFIVPMVNTRAQAEAVVSSFRYPKRGRRGYAAPIVRGSDWGTRPDYAREEAHDELVLMLQCEHVDAVENLDEIASVPGIDLIFIGPNDLAASAGHLERMEHPEVQALLKRVEDTAARHGIGLATVRGGGRDWADLARLGYRLVAGVNDISMLIESARRSLAELEGSATGAAPEGY